MALVQGVSWLLSVLLEWQVSDPLLLYCHCLLLEGFKRFYRYFDQQLWAVLVGAFRLSRLTIFTHACTCICLFLDD